MHSIESAYPESSPSNTTVRAIGAGTRSYVSLDHSLFTVDHARSIDEGYLGAARDHREVTVDPAEGIRPGFS